MKFNKFSIAGWKYNLFGGVVALIPFKYRVIILYILKLRSFPKLSNPTSFNEKILWRKLYDNNDYSLLADKVASKDFVKSRSNKVMVPNILWQGKNAHDINFEKLPSDYVIKANHGSRMNIIVRNSNHPSVENLNEIFKRWHKHDQASVLGEKAYGKITPIFFIEEFLDFDAFVPVDYKFFVYHGKVKYLQIDTGRFTEHFRNIITSDWQETFVTYSHPRLEQSDLTKPDNYQDMLQVAESIAHGFDFLRVDLYSDHNNVYFGEITIYPGAGYEPFNNKEDDEMLGENWHVK